jgi:hypothetical protein
MVVSRITAVMVIRFYLEDMVAVTGFARRDHEGEAMNPSGLKPSNPNFIPRLVFWEVTKGCNLRCVHCRATATELASPTDLPTPKALDIIDQIAEFCKPDPGAERRRTALPSRHFPTRALRHGQGPARRAGDQRNAGHQGDRPQGGRLRREARLDLAGRFERAIRTTPSEAFRARSTQRSTASAT